MTHPIGDPIAKPEDQLSAEELILIQPALHNLAWGEDDGKTIFRGRD